MSSVRQLIDFINEHNGDVDTTEAMIDRFTATTPPRRFLPLSCPNLSPRYDLSGSDEQLIREIQSILRSRSLADILVVQVAVQAIKKIQEHFNYDVRRPANYQPGDPAPESVLRYFLLARALGFELAALETSPHRASHAAITLFKALQKSGLAFFVDSNTAYDHVIVSIGSKQKGWYVYDPLTNPELIFEHGFFRNRVLPTFPESNHKGLPYRLKITNEVVSEFEARREKASNYILAALKSSKPTFDELRHDLGFTVPLSDIITLSRIDDAKKLVVSAIVGLEKEKQASQPAPSFKR